MTEDRKSHCGLCGRTKTADPHSPYFVARPEMETDSDWDGCTAGMGN